MTDQEMLKILTDLKDRLHQLDVALGVDGSLAAEVFLHLEQRIKDAIAKVERLEP